MLNPSCDVLDVNATEANAKEANHNGAHTNGHGANGNGANGHGANGHDTNGHSSNGNGTAGHHNGRHVLESQVIELVVELTGVPATIVDLNSELEADLSMNDSARKALRDEIGRRFELPGIDHDALRTRPKVADLVALIESMQAKTHEASSNGNGAKHTADNATPDADTQANAGEEKPRTWLSEESFRAIIAQLEDDPNALTYAKHLNPIHVVLGKIGGWLTTFARGEGNYLWSESGERFLDFVAGCGSVNLGHNPPEIADAIQEAMQAKAPGFAQSALHSRTAQLAEKLTRLAPQGIEMAFFCNSGTEAVEAALKIARAATGRTGLLCCRGGYHGKTMGALSITSHQPFQESFKPLIAECVSVPYGHERVLRRALETKQFAAFVVEPVQGERGTIVPPAGYLRAAQEICRETGTLFIVDEVQTGMGRTGKLFACEHEDVQPDVVTVAKSLGGGMMPIGAMLVRRDVWLKAYGSTDRFALHTSTFGGGSLACAAGLAALDSLSKPELLANVRERGEQLRNGLVALAKKHPTAIKEVRTAGLMAGIELLPVDETIATIVRRTIESDNRQETKELIANPDSIISTLPSSLAIEFLFKEHKIYALMARSNPLTIRVQPPLTITEAEIEYFLNAMDAVCQKIGNPVAIMGHLLSQSVPTK